MNLNDEEALAYLKEKVKKYDNMIEKGYKDEIEPPENDISITSLYDISPITWRMLRLSRHLLVYFNLLTVKKLEERKERFEED